MKRMGGLLAAAVAVALTLGGCGQMDNQVIGPKTGTIYTIVEEQPLYEALYGARQTFSTETVERLRAALIRDPMTEYISNFGAGDYDSVEFHAAENTAQPGSERFMKKSDMTEEGIMQRADAFLTEMDIYPTGEFYVEANVGKDGAPCTVNYRTTWEGVSLPFSRIELTFTDDRIEQLYYDWFIVESAGKRLDAADYLSGAAIVERFENDYPHYELGQYIESQLVGGAFEPAYLETVWPTDVADPDGLVRTLHPAWKLIGRSDCCIYLNAVTGEKL